MNAFANCGLKELTIPDSVTTIRRYAFENNNLTSLIIPDSVTLVEESAFSLNRELTDVTLGTGLKEIPDGMFTNCNLSSIIIPEGVTSIQPAFGGNNDPFEITIPASVTRIGGDLESRICGSSYVLVHTPAGSYAEQYVINQASMYTYDNNY